LQDKPRTGGRTVSTPTVCNVHERLIPADPELVWELLMTMSGPHDRLWPARVPPLRFDGPLVVGARGRHGPIHYELTSLQPTARTLVFQFRHPTDLVGHHSFKVSPHGQSSAVLRHEVIADPTRWMRLRWPLMVRWIHDAFVEEVLDQAERALGGFPAHPHQRSRWVKSLLALGARRPRAIDRPTGPAPARGNR
jgi:hypothetical protein